MNLENFNSKNNKYIYNNFIDKIKNNNLTKFLPLLKYKENEKYEKLYIVENLDFVNVKINCKEKINIKEKVNCRVNNLENIQYIKVNKKQIFMSIMLTKKILFIMLKLR
jgi:hypothetical protein